MKKKWLISMLVIGIVLGFFVGDKYARYCIYNDALKINALVEEMDAINDNNLQMQMASNSDEVSVLEDGEGIYDVDEENNFLGNSESETIKENVKENISVNKDSKQIVNLNTASVNELITLNGIGEAKAKAIISYREKYTRFNSIEEIKNVSGIGDKTFENIKNYIKVE